MSQWNSHCTQGSLWHLICVYFLLIPEWVVQSTRHQYTTKFRISESRYLDKSAESNHNIHVTTNHLHSGAHTCFHSEITKSNGQEHCETTMFCHQTHEPGCQIMDVLSIHYAQVKSIKMRNSGL